MAFHRIPPEIWEKIVLHLGRRDLASLALVSRRTYPPANRLLYEQLEISFCKCSQRYFESLERVMTSSAALASLVHTLLVDMTTTCRVRPSSPSLDDLASARWKDKFKWLMPTPNSSDREGARLMRREADWHRDAIRTLQCEELQGILPCLKNLENISIILGRSFSDADILQLLLDMIPGNVLRQVRTLKLRDVKTVDNPRVFLFSSLRTLDLGYVTISNVGFCEVLAANAGTLEELRLSWVMETAQVSILAKSAGISLPELRVFRSKGNHVFALDGLKVLFGETRSLQEFYIEALSAGSALTWARVLPFLAGEGGVPLQDMRRLSFGAPVGCGTFWEAVGSFMTSCGSQLQYFAVNGSPKGLKGPFPSALRQAFEQGTEQPHLKRVILAWRDSVGVDYDSVKSLQHWTPNVEHLHLTIPVPMLDSASYLALLVQPFEQLRQLHYVFPVCGDDAPSHVRVAFAALAKDIRTRTGMVKAFLEMVVDRHPYLERLSWTVYEYIHPELQPAFFVKINRTSDSDYELEDLLKRYGDTGEDTHAIHRMSIGTQKVLLGRKPGWREDMDKPAAKEGRLCVYAEYYHSESNAAAPVRQEL